MQRNALEFKQRLRSRQPLLGTFMKTPSHILFEVMALTQLDFVVMDKEHAPFALGAMDACVMAARAGGLPVITRLPSSRPDEIQSCLDIGGTGVLVPHICTREQAESLVRDTTYGLPGGRGYAGSTRAACYATKDLARHMADTAARTTVIASIEDPCAVEAVEEIAAVPGLDGMFIGPMDLTVSFGQSSPEAPVVQNAIRRICEAGRNAGIGVGIFAGQAAAVARYREMGMTFFLIGSDHAFMMAEANRACTAFREATGAATSAG